MIHFEWGRRGSDPYASKGKGGFSGKSSVVEPARNKGEKGCSTLAGRRGDGLARGRRKKERGRGRSASYTYCNTRERRGSPIDGGSRVSYVYRKRGKRRVLFRSLEERGGV